VNIYNMLKNRLYFDNVVMFIFICVILTILYTVYTWSFNFLSMGMLHDFSAQMIEQTITRNMDIFGVSPLRGEAFHTMPSEFFQAYQVLSNHPSWILNWVLIRATWIGQVTLMLTGIAIATMAYRNKNETSENIKTFGVLKKQMFTVFCFVAALLVVVSVLGIATGYFRYFQMRGTEEMQMLLGLYEIEGLWRPNLLYYISAISWTFVHLLSCAIFGIFVGHLFKNALLAFIAFYMITTYFIGFSFYITPVYFLQGLSGYFIMAVGGFPTTPGDSFIFSLLLLMLYLVAIIFASKKLLDLRFRSQIVHVNDSEV
ncbi:MAG: hypothetical protein FWC93_05840, partial [Defluviitaleaceae bacterium]|nr:hypothetical protein [Defluviitaleaceae bacterium]